MTSNSLVNLSAPSGSGEVDEDEKEARSEDPRGVTGVIGLTKEGLRTLSLNPADVVEEEMALPPSLDDAAATDAVSSADWELLLRGVLRRLRRPSANRLVVVVGGVVDGAWPGHRKLRLYTHEVKSESSKSSGM